MFCIVIVVILCDSASIICQMINWFLSIKITFIGLKMGGQKWPTFGPGWFR